MRNLTLIILTTTLISLISFTGVLILFFKEKLLNKILVILVAFSTGTLIGGAFLHLMPEAISQYGKDENKILKLFLFLVFGFCVFFILEQILKWHHHHSTSHPEIVPFSYLILISDAVHNFIDGLVIAAAFIVAVPIGITTTLAIALHEIPQEIGDYGVLIYCKINKIKALFLNFLSALTIILGGIAGFFLAEKINHLIIFLLPFAAGTFTYIAASDLIPEIKYNVSFRKSLICFLVFLSGIGLMAVIRFIA